MPLSARKSGAKLYSPTVKDDINALSLPGSCGPGMKSFSNVGRGIKASKSLQNLEQITKVSIIYLTFYIYCVSIHTQIILSKYLSIYCITLSRF